MLPPETPQGHCRLGWSRRTGSLQAPVGYDKYSYAYRDIAGSKVPSVTRYSHSGVMNSWTPKVRFPGGVSYLGRGMQRTMIRESEYSGSPSVVW